MKDVLETLENIPVTSSVIASLYPHISGKNQKISELEKVNKIIRLKRGMFVVNPEISGKTLSIELIANHLYTPSYISMLSALRYYGLIPEAVYTMQSMTIKHSRDFDNRLGRFEYAYIPHDVFSIGLTSVQKENVSFVIATPEKALCDLIANSSKVNLRYMKDVEAYLEDDIRIDMDEFKKMNPAILQEYIEVGKKANSIKTILKFLKR